MASNAQRRHRNLWLRQNGMCWLCFRPINLASTSTKLGPSIDHLLPKALGGNGVHYNSLLAHQRCNRRRGCFPESWTRDEVFEVMNMFTCGVAQWESGRLITGRSQVRTLSPLPVGESDGDEGNNQLGQPDDEHRWNGVRRGNTERWVYAAARWSWSGVDSFGVRHQL